jgi:hypothetical protein
MPQIRTSGIRRIIPDRSKEIRTSAELKKLGYNPKIYVAWNCLCGCKRIVVDRRDNPNDFMFHTNITIKE